MMLKIRRIAKSSPKAAEFVRFCIVGVVATLIDAAVFFVANQYVSYMIALVTAYFISLVFNYIFTILWTFKQKPSTKNAVAVVFAHLFNLFVVRWGLMFLFVSLLTYKESLSYILTLSFSTISNFIVVRYVVKKTGTACRNENEMKKNSSLLF